jgi:hypothetical protein
LVDKGGGQSGRLAAASPLGRDCRELAARIVPSKGSRLRAEREELNLHFWWGVLCENSLAFRVKDENRLDLIGA